MSLAMDGVSSSNQEGLWVYIFIPINAPMLVWLSFIRDEIAKPDCKALVSAQVKFHNHFQV